FLPQLMQCAETSKRAFALLKEHFASDAPQKGVVMMATVEGDIHDIGKNIVKVVVESYGYRVIDLGKDVKAEDVVAAFRRHHPQAIGLSALMTTTLPSMEKTIRLLREEPNICPIWVGGAVLSEEYAKEIHADHYTADAMATVDLLERIL
ncbi:MAG: cobalamin-dependent protein, partial [Merdibacter sp.]